MLKKFDNEENLKMNVHLVDGSQFLECDMAVAAETAGVCKFWIGEVMMIVPWEEIKRVEIYEAGNNPPIISQKKRKASS